MSAFEYREMESWPPLAWLAVCDASRGPVLVFHGSRVETREAWFCEAVWDGDFEAGGFDEHDRVFGSGGRARDGSVRFVASGETLDRLHHVQRGGGTWVSNSLACLVISADLELDAAYPDFVQDFQSVKRGYRDCVRQVPTTDGPVELTYYDELVWSRGELQRAPRSHQKQDLGSFAAYRRFMDGAIAGILANARSAARAHRYEPIAALSYGMDSGASTALVVPHGLREAFTFRTARRGRQDSGVATARALGLELHGFERDAWRDRELPEVPFFLADARGPDVFYCAAEALLPGRLLVTGYMGGGLWGTRKRQEGDDIRRVDTSGLSLTEYRLWTGSIHLPVPALGYRQAPEIDAIGRQPEMDPWHVEGSYDKPVARRILLEAGVPEESIARYNHATTVLWAGESTFLSRGSRADFVAWLRAHESELAPAHGGSPLRDLPRDDLRTELGRRLMLFAKAGPGRQPRTKAVARRLLRGSDPRPVMRYFLPWAMEHARRRYARPELPA